jgi:hypothetical protein
MVINSPYGLLFTFGGNYHLGESLAYEPIYYFVYHKDVRNFNNSIIKLMRM